MENKETKKTLSLKERLIEIQCELKAPKDKFNSYGKYSYRSAEGIMEALKPLLKKYEVLLTINDDVVQIGDRYYFKSTAALSTDNESLQVSAFAREDEKQTGMTAAQLSGSTISYCHKYCLGSLFLLDDAKDPDTDEYHEQNDQPKTSKDKRNQAKSSEKPNRDALVSYCKENGLDMGKIAHDFKLNGNVPDKVFAEVLKKLKEEEE